MSAAPLVPASAESEARAAELLRAGELVVFPTDTVYGIGAAVYNPKAVARLFVAKGRPSDRPIPVLVSGSDQIARLTSHVDPRVARLIERFWPGALTVVLPAAPWLPGELVRGTGTVGLRFPDNEVARSIIRQAGGAVATTSANRSGEPEARTAAEAAEALGAHVALIVDGGPASGGVPSTVITFEGDELRVLRAGAIPPEALPQRLGSA
ncbi:MAG TPA: L-threonylcarbamoyladenylate synthase [Thermomicrobiaceae bacterium]|nr:L-threonylcarbamoyladenylate synthase [Thermomicrobiaceae bacterium]